MSILSKVSLVAKLNSLVCIKLIWKIGILRIMNFCLILWQRNYVYLSAYFQHGFPIYSAKAVRFRMGHPRHPMELESAVDKMATNDVLGDNQFIWTYTSPEFPMFQVSCTIKMQVLHILFYPFNLLIKEEAWNPSTDFFMGIVHLFIKFSFLVYW